MTTQNTEMQTSYYETPEQGRDFILGLADCFLSNTITARETSALFDALHNAPEYFQLLPNVFEGYMHLLTFKGLYETFPTTQEQVSPLTPSEKRKYKAVANQTQGMLFDSPLPHSTIGIQDLAALVTPLQEKEVKNFVSLTSGSLIQESNLVRQEIKGNAEEKRRTKFINTDSLIYEPNPFKYGFLKLFTRLHPDIISDLLITISGYLGLIYKTDFFPSEDTDTKKAKQTNNEILKKLSAFLDDRIANLPNLEKQVAELEEPLGNLHKRHTLTQRKPIEDIYIEIAITYLTYIIKCRHVSENNKITNKGIDPKFQLDILMFSHRMFEGAQQFIHNPRRLQSREYLEQKVETALGEYLPRTSEDTTDTYKYLNLLIEPQEEFDSKCFFSLDAIPKVKLHPFACEDKRSDIDIFELKSHSYFFYADISALTNESEREILLDYLAKLELNGFYFMLVATIHAEDPENSVLNTWLKSKPARFKLAQTSTTETSMNICVTNYNFQNGISIKELWKD